MNMSETPMREMSLAEILDKLPIGHRARKEFNEFSHNLSIANNKVEELENAMLDKITKNIPVDHEKCMNNAFKATDMFVEKGGISREETHVDFDILSESVVTWALEDEPMLKTTPSVFIRRIADVRQIIRLKKKQKEIIKQRDDFEDSLMAEISHRDHLAIEVDNLKKQIENLTTPDCSAKTL